MLLQAECPDEKYRHLGARNWLIRAVIAAAATGRNPVSRESLDPGCFPYWVKCRRQQLWHYEIAGDSQPADWREFGASLFASVKREVQQSEYFDSNQQTYRLARFVRNRLDSCLFVGPGYELPPRDWLIEIFTDAELSEADMMALYVHPTQEPTSF